MMMQGDERICTRINPSRRATSPRAGLANVDFSVTIGYGTPAGGGRSGTFWRTPFAPQTGEFPMPRSIGAMMSSAYQLRVSTAPPASTAWHWDTTGRDCRSRSNPRAAIGMTTDRRPHEDQPSAVERAGRQGMAEWVDLGPYGVAMLRG
jgi:hypothetical protein